MAKQLKLFKKPVPKAKKSAQKAGLSVSNRDSSRRTTPRTIKVSKITVRTQVRTKNNPDLKIKGRSDATIGANAIKRHWHWRDYFVSSPLKLPARNKREKPVVFVGMSGGVDSSFTAYILKEQGFEVVGVFMKNWSFPIKQIKDCPLYQDYKDMVKVCKFLKIPYLVFSFEKDYRKRVIDPFFKGYEAGLTPNPDVLCNTEIKFDNFLKKSLQMGADFIATGHHIRSRCADPKSLKVSFPVILATSSVILSEVVSDPEGLQTQREESRDPSTSPPSAPAGGGGSTQDDKKTKKIQNGKDSKTCKDYQLLKGKDPIKDQTYFVYGLTQAQLAKCLFPIGDYIKKDLREMAKKANLPTAERRDSQGICFIGNINVKPFLKTRLPEKEGDIVTKEGKKVGKHEGAWFYTTGQRRIEGLSGTIKPLYVIGKDIKKNLVIVGDDKDTYAKSARLAKLHLINKTIKPKDLMDIVLTAKSRYTPEVSRGRLGKDKKGYYFEFIKPERAITAGQSLVLYKGDICLGGGIITKFIV